MSKEKENNYIKNLESIERKYKMLKEMLSDFDAEFTVGDCEYPACDAIFLFDRHGNEPVCFNSDSCDLCINCQKQYCNNHLKNNNCDECI